MRLIDADAFIERFSHTPMVQEALKIAMDKMPTIETKRKKGHWIEEDDGWDGVFWRCSVCNEPFYLVDGTPVDNKYYFCPNCGADMREKQND